MRSLQRLLPRRVQLALRPIYRVIRKPKPASRDDAHAYWRAPWDGETNAPATYLAPTERSEYLLEMLARYVDHNARVLEIGCNVGRNLNWLYEAGFRNLEAIEISENAIAMLRKSYPEMAHYITIHNAPVESVIANFPESHYDVVFTMAVLEHIHPDSEWIFPHIARISKRYVITIEDEVTEGWTIFRRNYGQIFESLGMRQVEVDSRTPLGADIYYARVFARA